PSCSHWPSPHPSLPSFPTRRSSDLFGFLANRSRRAKLARCRDLLAQPPAPLAPPTDSVSALMLRLTGIDIERCPICQQGRLRVTEILVPTSPPTRCVPVVDTS